MITLTHLAILVILLITFGAFLVQRSAIERARNYRRGREDSLDANDKLRRELERVYREKPLAPKPAWGQTPSSADPAATMKDLIDQIEAQNIGLYGPRLETFGGMGAAIRPASKPAPNPIFQQPPQIPKDELPRRAFPEMPSKE